MSVGGLLMENIEDGETSELSLDISRVSGRVSGVLQEESVCA